MPKFKIHLKKGNIPDSKFNKVQLAKGTRVEMEHSNQKYVAKQVAKAHLVESKNYYTYLDKMEKCMKKHEGK